jgi:hypothetical protein
MKFLITFGSLFLLGLPLLGREFVVITTQDGTSVYNLRGAIIAANALGGHNTITLRQGTYRLGGYTALEITNGNLTITGRRGTIIDASGLLGGGILDNSVFHISSDARATFDNLTITGGVGYGGGGISNLGQLVLDNCDISGNYSGGFGGGGINNSGDLTMFNCSVSGNSGGIRFGFSSNGGGIYNTGNLVINNCVISGNSTQPGADGDYFPGGLAIFPVGFIPGFDGEAGGDGGGIYNAGDLFLNNSFIIENACGSGGNGSDSMNDNAGNGGNGGNGGGIFNLGSLVLNHCTVRNNSCGAGGNGGNETTDPGRTPKDGNGGNGGSGGGIFNAADASDARLLNRTSVHSNSAGLGGEPGTNGDFGLNGSGPDLFWDIPISR